MAKRLLSYDPLSGMKTWHERDHTANKTHITYESDWDALDRVNAINEEQANSHKYNWMNRDGKGGGMRKVATFTPFVQMLWLNKYGYSPLDKDMLKVTLKRLNDPEWRKLKTSSERL